MNVLCFIEEKSKGNIKFDHGLSVCFPVIFFPPKFWFPLCVDFIYLWKKKIAIFVPLLHICIIYSPGHRENFCSSIPRRNPEIQYY